MHTMYSMMNRPRDDSLPKPTKRESASARLSRRLKRMRPNPFSRQAPDYSPEQAAELSEAASAAAEAMGGASSDLSKDAPPSPTSTYAQPAPLTPRSRADLTRAAQEAAAAMDDDGKRRSRRKKKPKVRYDALRPGHRTFDLKF